MAERQKFFELIRPGTSIEFIGHTRFWVALSVVATLVVVAMFPLNHYVFKSRGSVLNWGIDFRGGTEMVVDFNKEIESGVLREVLDKHGFENSDVVRVQEPNKVKYILRLVAFSVLTPEREAEVRTALAQVQGVAATKFEFTADGGDKFYPRFAQAVEPQAIRDQLQKAGIDVLQAQPFGRPDDHVYEVTVAGLDQAVSHALEAGLGKGVVESIPQVETVGPKAGEELRNDGIKSLLYAILLIMVYIALRFDITYGPGTVVALLHDAVLTVGAFAITYREFTLTTLAALLTIIGFSMNDTIVVFDRIREDVGRFRDKKFDRVVNEAINHTLSRTILTSATVFFVTLAMNIWGTGLIRDFAFAMNVGIIVGTYSSIFIASPVLIWLHDRMATQKKRGSSKLEKSTSRRQSLRETAT